MFKNEFQGGQFLEILSVQSKDFTSKCKVFGSSINGGQKEFEKSIRSNVLILEGESTRSKVIIPKDEKQSLYILQPYLVIQLHVLPGVSFSLEAVVMDTSNQKRRILMSTSYRDISVTAFHVKIPLTILKRGHWLNLCLDLASFVSDSFKGQSYRALESVVICANCRLRRVFTLKGMPRDDVSEDAICDADIPLEEIPRALQFATLPDSHHYTQVLNMKALVNSDIKFRTGSGVPTPSNADAENVKTDKSSRTHIAFGSRIRIPKHALKSAGRSGLNSSTGLERQVSSTSLSSSGGLNKSSSHVDLDASASSIPQVEGQKPVLVPRPPKPGSGKVARRPNPRIRSAESGRIVKRAKVKLDESNANCKIDNDQLGIPSSNNPTADVSRGSESSNCIRSRADTDRTDSKKSLVEKDETDDMHKHEIYYGTSDLDRNRKLDMNNNVAASHQSTDANTESILGNVSQKLVFMKMGSQDDEQDYFRSRRDSESQDETRQSKDGSLTSSVESEALFLYASRPRSLLNGARNRKNSDNSSKSLNLPQVVIEKPKNDDFGSLESDFHRNSSDSDNDDPVEKYHRLSGSQRNSPRSSPLLFSQKEESMSIRSSLLKEIPKPSNSYNHLKYQSVQSDSMSWMYDSSDSSQMTQLDASINMDNSVNDKFSPIKRENDNSPRNPRLRILDQLPEGMELGNDSDDAMSDGSDETSYSTWKAPPAHIRNYRYQDEMHGVGMTLDLTATLPMTPCVDDKRLIKDANIDNTDSGISIQEDSTGRKQNTLRESELELDLVFDPVLNCFYDPRTFKYYELA